jgi:oxygen-independent coproporphyrinogen-3 oxidase
MVRKKIEIELSRKNFIANYPHFRYWKKQAASDMLAEEPVNIYIHVPFCVQKCAYCYYKTERYRDPGQLAALVDGLSREIRLANRRFNLRPRPVKSIYIGGGTPSLLKEELLAALVDCLRQNFDIREPEFTIEAEPRTLNDRKVRAYKELGVNRISIGIQSFNDEIVKLSGRKHTGKRALEAIDIVKQAGDFVINIDLLSGLAGETEASWSRTLDTAIAAQVHNITVYKMETYFNTEFFNKGVRKNLLELPSEAQELRFMEMALEKFAASPYKPWSFFTFTLNGDYQHRYATNLWHGQDCCAFGPSAFGLLGHYNYQNVSSLDNYFSLLEEETLPVVRGYRLTSKDVMLRDVLLGLKLDRFSRGRFSQRHGFDLCRVVPDTVEALRRDDFLQLDDEAITLTSKGILYGDYVGKRLAAALKQYLGPDKLNLY